MKEAADSSNMPQQILDEILKSIQRMNYGEVVIWTKNRKQLKIAIGQPEEARNKEVSNGED